MLSQWDGARDPAEKILPGEAVAPQEYFGYLKEAGQSTARFLSGTQVPARRESAPNRVLSQWDGARDPAEKILAGEAVAPQEYFVYFKETGQSMAGFLPGDRVLARCESTPKNHQAPNRPTSRLGAYFCSLISNGLYLLFLWIFLLSSFLRWASA